MTYPNFETIWQNLQAEKATKLAAKYSSVSEAFKAFESPESIRLLASIIHPGQRLLRWEKTGSSQVADTAGLPYYSDRKEYTTVRYGTVYYFHASTLKEGDTVEWDNCKWQVLMNHFSRGSAGTLAYQCIYLLEVK